MIKPTPEIDAFICAAALKHNVPYELLYAQVKQESAFNPIAVSHCGARGLLQIMPPAGKDLGMKESDFFNPEVNLERGAFYLRRQYQGSKRMVETMKCVNECTDDDYWKLGLASYNGGLGYIIAAINLCVQDGLSVCWPNVAEKLADRRCSVRGKHPDYKQMTDYVTRIWADYRPSPKPSALMGEGKKGA